MENMKNMKKVWMNSLSFLDNSVVNSIIVVILVLYSSTIFDNINSFIGNIYNFSIIRLVILLLIIYVAPKDITIAILLSISYLISLNYMINNENFSANSMEHNYIKEEHMHPTHSEHSEHSEHYKNNKNSEHFSKSSVHNKKTSTIESFFPLMETQQTNNDEKKVQKSEKAVNSEASYDLRLNNINMNTRSPTMLDNNLNEKACLTNYNPKFEAVSNVCVPNSTFKNELNTQGLNFPEGFNHYGSGSPL
jgi:hypothetical protein